MGLDFAKYGREEGKGEILIVSTRSEFGISRVYGKRDRREHMLVLSLTMTLSYTIENDVNGKNDEKVNMGTGCWSVDFKRGKSEVRVTSSWVLRI